MNLLGRFIYMLLGIVICAGLLIASDRLESSKLIIPENYTLKTSEVTCTSCPLPEAVKCDLSDIKFTCEFDASVSNYWENVFPSKQCHGVKIKDMSVMKDYTYATGSMRPYIYKGDDIYVVRYDPKKELVLGDIVSNGNSLHRIVSINFKDETYQTKGDNNYKKDMFGSKFSDTEYVVCGVMRGTE